MAAESPTASRRRAVRTGSRRRSPVGCRLAGAAVRRRSRFGTRVFAATALGLAVAAAPGVGARADASPRAEIVRPAPGHGIVPGRKLPIRIVLPPGAGRISVELAGEEIGDRLRRVGRRLVGRIGHGIAEPGLHLLTVGFTRRDGDRDWLGREVLVPGRRAPRLLRIRRPHHPVRGVARLRLRSRRADHWLVQLNGRDVSHRFASHAGYLRGGRLSASFGLRHGGNRVVVSAARDDGRHETHRFTIRVRPRAPLPAAGRHLHTAAGRAVRLDGRRAVASRDRTELRHHWEVIAAPPGSDAKLRGERSQRPRFRPDVRGTYRISHRVSEHRRSGERVGVSAADVVEIAATPRYVPPIGVRLVTQVLTPRGNRGVLVGKRVYPRYKDFQVVAIDPGTLEVSNHNFDRASKAIARITEDSSCAGEQSDSCVADPLPAGTLVVVTGSALDEWIRADGSALRKIGLPNGWIKRTPSKNQGSGFSLIGVEGAPVGQGWTNTIGGSLSNSALGAIEGYIAPNYTLLASQSQNAGNTTPGAGAFTFTPSTYVSYDTNTTGAGAGATSVTARVGDERATGTLAAGQAGFLVAAFDAATLKLRDHEAFAVADLSSNTALPAGVTGLRDWLRARESEPEALVLVQSIGALPSPLPNQGLSIEMHTQRVWGEAANAIEKLGGHGQLFLTTTGGYTLLGGAAIEPGDAHETATNLLPYGAQPVGTRLAGVIGLGHRGTLQPATYTPILTPNAKPGTSAGPNFELPVIAYQDPKPWPYSRKPAYVAALHWISRKLCKPQACIDDDIRTLYTVANYDLDGLISSAPRFGCRDGTYEGTAFTQAQCSRVLDQLEEEFGKLERLGEYFTDASGGALYPLEQAFAFSGSALESIGNDIQNAVNPPQTVVHFSWLTLFEGIATAFEALDPEVIPFVAAFATEIDAGLNLASAFSTTTAGVNEMLKLEIAVDQAITQVRTTMQTQLDAINNVLALLRTDWGKLSAIDRNINGTSPAWNIPVENIDAVVTALEWGARAAFYRLFLPALGYENEVVPQWACAQTQQVLLVGDQAPTPENNCNDAGRSPVLDISNWTCIVEELLGSEWAWVPAIPFEASSEYGASVFQRWGPSLIGLSGANWHAIGKWDTKDVSSGHLTAQDVLDASVSDNATAQPGVDDPNGYNGGLAMTQLFDSFETKVLAPVCPKAPSN